MTGSSGVVISNLAYLIGAIVLAVAGGLLVWIRHRRPKSVAANVAYFHRGLRALAPDERSTEPGRSGSQPESRPELRSVAIVRPGATGSGDGTAHPAGGSRRSSAATQGHVPESDAGGERSGAESG